MKKTSLVILLFFVSCRSMERADHSETMPDTTQAVVASLENFFRPLFPEDMSEFPKEDIRKLYEAIKQNHTDVVSQQIAAGVDPNAYHFKDTVLHLAAGWGRKSAVQMLLAAGGNPNLINGRNGGSTPLTDAVNSASNSFSLIGKPGYKEIVDTIELLLDNGADPNFGGHSGWTPLHCAARWNLVEIATLLCSKGADPQKKNMYDRTPLDIAVLCSSDKMIELLKNK